MNLDEIRNQVKRHAEAVGPGGEKAWLDGQLARRAPELIAEIERLRNELDGVGNILSIVEKERDALAAMLHAAASGSSSRAQAPAVEGAVSVIDPAVTVPVVRPVDLHFGLRPAGDDRVRLADLDMRDQGQAVRHASPNCACGVNDAGQRYVDSICRTGDN